MVDICLSFYYFSSSLNWNSCYYTYFPSIKQFVMFNNKKHNIILHLQKKQFKLHVQRHFTQISYYWIQINYINYNLRYVSWPILNCLLIMQYVKSYKPLDLTLFLTDLESFFTIYSIHLSLSRVSIRKLRYLFNVM